MSTEFQLLVCRWNQSFHADHLPWPWFLTSFVLPDPLNFHSRSLVAVRKSRDGVHLGHRIHSLLVLVALHVRIDCFDAHCPNLDVLAAHHEVSIVDFCILSKLLIVFIFDQPPVTENIFSLLDYMPCLLCSMSKSCVDKAKASANKQKTTTKTTCARPCYLRLLSCSCLSVCEVPLFT